MHIDKPEDAVLFCNWCASPLKYNGIWPHIDRMKPVTQGEGYYKFYCHTCGSRKGVSIKADNPPVWSGDWEYA